MYQQFLMLPIQRRKKPTMIMQSLICSTNRPKEQNSHGKGQLHFHPQTPAELIFSEFHEQIILLKSTGVEKCVYKGRIGSSFSWSESINPNSFQRYFFFFLRNDKLAAIWQLSSAWVHFIPRDLRVYLKQENKTTQGIKVILLVCSQHSHN